MLYIHYVVFIRDPQKSLFPQMNDLFKMKKTTMPYCIECLKDDIKKTAYYGIEKGKPLVCKQHNINNWKNVAATKQCELCDVTRSEFVTEDGKYYCTLHQTIGSYKWKLPIPRCQKCNNVASFGEVLNEPLYCLQHAPPNTHYALRGSLCCGVDNGQLCTYSHCKSRKYLKGGFRVCGIHAKGKTIVDDNRRKVCNCPYKGNMLWGPPGEEPVRCNGCKHSTDVNESDKRMCHECGKTRYSRRIKVEGKPDLMLCVTCTRKLGLIEQSELYGQPICTTCNTKRAIYPQKKPIYCPECKPKECPLLESKRCIKCQINPAIWGYKPSLRMFCDKCNPGDTIKAGRTYCEECQKHLPMSEWIQASWGYAESTKRRWCAAHKPAGAIDLANHRCEFTYPDGKKCSHVARANRIDGKWTRCFEHYEPDHTGWRDQMCIECELDNINTVATFGPSPTAMFYCKKHNVYNYPNMRSIMCNYVYSDGIQCKKQAMFGKYERCSLHNYDNLPSIFKDRCQLCNWSRARMEKYKPYCGLCYSKLFPTSSLIKGFKERELAVKKTLQTFYPNDRITHNISMGPSMKRPDFMIEAKRSYIIIEVDENQHSGHSMDENARMQLIYDDLRHMPAWFIRFNPDSYVDSNGKTHDSAFITGGTQWENRIKTLYETIEKCKISNPNEGCEAIHLFYDGFIIDQVS